MLGRSIGWLGVMLGCGGACGGSGGAYEGPDKFACGSGSGALMCVAGQVCQTSRQDGTTVESSSCVAAPDACGGGATCDCLSMNLCGMGSGQPPAVQCGCDT